jgi:hypothetical protein
LPRCLGCRTEQKSTNISDNEISSNEFWWFNRTGLVRFEKQPVKRLLFEEKKQTTLKMKELFRKPHTCELLLPVS